MLVLSGKDFTALFISSAAHKGSIAQNRSRAPDGILNKKLNFIKNQTLKILLHRSVRPTCFTNT
jgi:hypothetical protein